MEKLYALDHKPLSIARENVTPNCSVKVSLPMVFSKPLEDDNNFREYTLFGLWYHSYV